MWLIFPRDSGCLLHVWDVPKSVSHSAAWQWAAIPIRCPSHESQTCYIMLFVCNNRQRSCHILKTVQLFAVSKIFIHKFITVGINKNTCTISCTPRSKKKPFLTFKEIAMHCLWECGLTSLPWVAARGYLKGSGPCGQLGWITNNLQQNTQRQSLSRLLQLPWQLITRTSTWSYSSDV